MTIRQRNTWTWICCGLRRPAAWMTGKAPSSAVYYTIQNQYLMITWKLLRRPAGAKEMITPTLHYLPTGFRQNVSKVSPLMLPIAIFLHASGSLLLLIRLAIYNTRGTWLQGLQQPTWQSFS